MKAYIKKLLPILAVVVVLAVAFWYGGNAPGLRGWNPGTLASTPPFPTSSIMPTAMVSVPPTPTPVPTALPVATETPSPVLTSVPPLPKATARPTETIPTVPPSETAQQSETNHAQMQGIVLDPDTGKDRYLTDPVPTGKPLPMEPQDAVITDTAYTCTLSVRCDTVLAHLDWLDPEKVELVPEDGMIFPATEVTFYDGESVFDVLQREMKRNTIHMEFVDTPIYNSAYIEGIHNLYEFDGGELSGWMYRVNGWFPNYGCSRYRLASGDTVEWVYTCDLGVDVGGGMAAGAAP